MRISIIADDLTGANDSGVQFAKRGFRTTVMMGNSDRALDGQEVVVFDTDSRSKSREEAYRLVREAAEWMKSQISQIVFKKIDSTMRGNIGAELDAMYDVYQPDFVVIAPAFPRMKRQVINGFHYVEGKLLHETEVANDPITPVTVSYLPELLGKQTERPLALITKRDLAGSKEYVLNKLEKLKQDGIAYLLFDSEDDDDLRDIVSIMNASGTSVVWAGSAGLAAHLPGQGEAGQGVKFTDMAISRPVLMVVGSVSRKARAQLREVLLNPDVVGVNLVSALVSGDPFERKHELERVFTLSHRALREGRNVVLYSTGDPEDVAEIGRLGAELGLTGAEIGTRIASALGEVAFKLVQALGLDGIVLTGGDTAKQFCKYARIREFILVDEVESGIPIGYLVGEKPLYAVTKAGGFGTNEALLKALQYLRRGESA